MTEQEINNQVRKHSVKIVVAIILGLILPIMLIVGYLRTTNCIINNNYKMPYVAVKNKELIGDVNIPSTNMTKAEIKQKIDKLFNNPFYIYWEDNIMSAGQSVIQMRLIIIDEDIPKSLYTLALAHELTHITAFTSSERYCNYNAFVKLYESGDEYLINVAKLWGNEWLQNNDTSEYACGGYIENYLLLNEI